MKWKIFETGIDKLRTLYGATTYPKARVDLFWDEFKTVSEEHWIRAIEDLVKESKFPPLAKELRAAISESRERMWALRKKEDSKAVLGVGGLLRSAPKNDPLIHAAAQAAIAAIEKGSGASAKCDQIATELEAELRTRCVRDGRVYYED